MPSELSTEEVRELERLVGSSISTLRSVTVENAADIKKALRREGNLAAKKRYYARNRSLIKEKARKYHEDHPEKRKIATKKSHAKRGYKRRPATHGDVLKWKYGISTDDYNKMFERQGGCCAVCSRHQSEFKRRLHVDHDHATGLVRDLLCSLCNTALGCARDKIETLHGLIAYLERHRS